MAKSITEKFLDQRDLFGIEWDTGYTFHEVTGWERVEYQPFEQLEDLDSGSNLSGRWSRLEDGAGDDVFHVPKDDKDKVLHAGIGHRPASIRRYAFYPEDQSRVGKFPNLSAPSPPDDYGYVDGEDSPYENPTDAQEFILPPGVRASFDFHNPTNLDHQPVLNILGRVYTVRVLDPEREEDANQIKRIASIGSPMPLYSIGTTRAKAEFDLNNEWDVDTLGLQEARNLNSNGRGRGRGGNNRGGR